MSCRNAHRLTKSNNTITWFVKVSYFIFYRTVRICFILVLMLKRIFLSILYAYFDPLWTIYYCQFSSHNIFHIMETTWEKSSFFYQKYKILYFLPLKNIKQLNRSLIRLKTFKKKVFLKKKDCQIYLYLSITNPVVQKKLCLLSENNMRLCFSQTWMNCKHIREQMI